MNKGKVPAAAADKAEVTQKKVAADKAAADKTAAEKKAATTSSAPQRDLRIPLPEPPKAAVRPIPPTDPTSHVPFPGSFRGACTNCKRTCSVSRHADFPATDQYCKACWGQWWGGKDRTDRPVAMEKEKESLRLRTKVDVAAWNAMVTVCRTVTTFQYVFSAPTTIRKKSIVLKYLRQVLPKTVFEEILPSIIFGADNVMYCERDIRPHIVLPLLRTVGPDSTDMELIPDATTEARMDPMKGGDVSLRFFNAVLRQGMGVAGLTPRGADLTRSRVYPDMVVVPAYAAVLRVLQKKTCVMVVRPRTRLEPTTTALSFPDIVGKAVVATYGSQKRYTVHKVDDSVNARAMCVGTRSFVEYYSEKYGVTVTRPDALLLWGDAEGKVKLVPELMLVVNGLSPESRRMLPVRCSRPPGVLLAEHAVLMKRLQDAPVKAFLERHGITAPDAATPMETVRPREMKPVQITVAGGIAARLHQDFGVVAMRVRLPAAMPRRVVTLHVWGDESVAIGAEICRLNEAMGGAWCHEDTMPHVAGTEDDETFCDRCVASTSSLVVGNAVVLCVLKDGHSKQGEDVYSRLKTALCKHGILSHFIDWSKYNSNKGPQQEPYLHNITKNMTTKMGTPLWRVNMVQHVPELSGVTMYIAHDVYKRRHGLVAWYHRADDTWHTYADVDVPLCDFVKTAFSSVVGSYICPRAVVYDTSPEHDYSALRDAVPPTTPNVCLLAVQKRVPDRFTVGGAEQPHNVPRGYAVDLGQNVFLQIATDCHASTTSPVRYTVVGDGKLKMDSIQQMTYALCWLYCDWQGSVRVPFVLQCAHKVASFHAAMGGRKRERTEVHPAMQTQPYYL